MNRLVGSESFVGADETVSRDPEHTPGGPPQKHLAAMTTQVTNSDLRELFADPIIVKVCHQQSQFVDARRLWLYRREFKPLFSEPNTAKA